MSGLGGEPVVLIGERDPERQRLAALCDDLCSDLIHPLLNFSTEDLLAMADYCDSVHRDGWMQQLIREYVNVDVWR